MLTNRGIKTQEKIVKAAAVLFSKQAVEKTPVRQICEVAGIAKGTFYIYFETKDDLVWYFVEHQFDELFQWLETIKTSDFKKETIYGFIDFISNYVTFNKTLLDTVHSSKFLEYLGLEKIKTHMEKRMMSPVCIWLKKGVEIGQLKHFDPEFVSKFLVLGIHEILDRIIYNQSDYTLQEVNKKLKETLVLFLLH